MVLRYCKKFLLLLMASLSLTFSAAAMESTNYLMGPNVVNAAGNTMGSANYLLFNSYCEPATGAAASTNYLAEIGFLNNGVAPTATPTPSITATPVLAIQTATPTSTATTIAIVSPSATPTPVPPNNYLWVFNNILGPLWGWQATIRWTQPHDAATTVTIYNPLPEKVICLANNQYYSAWQYHELKWDGRNEVGNMVASGTYIVLIQSRDLENQTKIMVIK